MIFLLGLSTLVTFFGAIKMGIFKNKMKINQTSQKHSDNTDAHFLNRNYGRTGCAAAQTDQQHSTSSVLIC
jgi:hypothetical protein